MKRLAFIWIADRSRIGIDPIPGDASGVDDDECVRLSIGRLRVSVLTGARSFKDGE